MLNRKKSVPEWMVKIEDLNLDEDTRQDLYVMCLSQSQEPTLKTNNTYYDTEAIEYIYSSDKCRSILNNFNNSELSLLSLLISGYNMDDISKLMGINITSVWSIYDQIRSNPAWVDFILSCR